jgi:hypothetical protein
MRVHPVNDHQPRKIIDTGPHQLAHMFIKYSLPELFASRSLMPETPIVSSPTAAANNKHQRNDCSNIISVKGKLHWGDLKKLNDTRNPVNSGGEKV